MSVKIKLLPFRIKLLLAGMATLAFIVLPDETCIYSKLKRMCIQYEVYSEDGYLPSERERYIYTETRNTGRQHRFSKLKVGS